MLPILKQEKELSDILIKSLDIKPGIWADVRLGNHTNFGGRRLGPYHCYAKPKGSKGPWLFYMIVHTKYVALDKNGKEVDLMDKSAIYIKETFIKVELKKNGNLNKSSKKENN